MMAERRPQAWLVANVATLVLAGSLMGAHQPQRDRLAQATQPTGEIRGTILQVGARRTPVRGAAVILKAQAVGADHLAVSADDGTFVLPVVPPGTYTLSAEKPGYVPSVYGSKRLGRGPGVPIAVEAGQAVSDITISLTPGAVISGTVADHTGRPQPGAIVSAIDTASGQPMAAPVQTARTNDRGVYRLFGLPPGNYWVAVQPGFNFNGASLTEPEQVQAYESRAFVENSAQTRTHDQSVGYAPTLYPGTPDTATAVRVAVSTGEERRGIDVTLELVPTATVQGRVTDPDGRPPHGLRLRMFWPGESLGLIGQTYLGTRPTTVAPLSNQTTFKHVGLAPGRYTFCAQASSGTASEDQAGVLDLWSVATLDVDGHDVPDFVIRLQEGMTVSGRLAFDGTHAAADPTTVQLRLTPEVETGFVVSPVQARSDGTFRFVGVAPGQYDLSTSLPDNGSVWVLGSLTYAQTDLLDSGIRVESNQDLGDLSVRLIDKHTTLMGTLVDAFGRPTSEYFVIVFPADRKLWTIARRIRRTRTGSRGEYEFRDLRPGKYLVAALTDVDQIDLSDPEFLRLVSDAAMGVGLVEGETKRLDLKIAGHGVLSSPSGHVLVRALR